MDYANALHSIVIGLLVAGIGSMLWMAITTLLFYYDNKSLRSFVSEVTEQNNELRNKLARLTAEADVMQIIIQIHNERKQ